MKVLDDQGIIVRVRWLLLAGLILALVASGCGSRLEVAQAGNIGEHVGEIRGERSAGQTFVARHDGLQAIDVLLATYARENHHPVTLHLRRDPQSPTDLRAATVSAAEIADNAYHRFSFAPLAESLGQRYYFFIDSPESQSGDAITAWTGPADGYGQGSLYVNGRAREGQLAFRLGYSDAHILAGMVRGAVRALPAGLAATLLFLLPGLALLVWLAPVWDWRGVLVPIVSTGLSAAVFPLLLLFSRLVGLRWNGPLTWLFLALCLGAVAWRGRGLVRDGRLRWPGWRGLFRVAPETWLLGGVILLVFGVRWLVVRPVSVPLWGDSHEHTTIVQLMVEHGGLFDSWEPYAPYQSLTVHFGFHAAGAFFHWVTGIESARAVTLVGQILNGLAVLTLYPLAMRIVGEEGQRSRRKRWAGVVAVLVAGLLMPMPMTYVNWGRYPQLAGQMILPVALWLWWSAAERDDRFAWAIALLAGIATAGMTLTYYRMPYYFAAFILPWLGLSALAQWRTDGRRWLRLAGLALLAGGAVFLLVGPWLPNVLGGRLANAVASGMQTPSAWEQVKAEYLVWRDIDPYVPALFRYLFVIGFLWSLARRQWRAILVGLWTAGLAGLVATRLIQLPGAQQMQNFAILIALYMPVGLLVGWFVADLVAWLASRTEIAPPLKWATWGRAGFSGLVLAAGLAGLSQQMGVVDPAYALVEPADEVAMRWIKENTPPGAVFLVNGFLIYDGYLAAGSDAGWWIPLLAARQNTMPPQYALFNETESIPGYSRAVVDLVATLTENPPSTPVGREALCRFGVTHVYIGQGHGRVAMEVLDPYLDPAALADSDDFDLQYHQDRVWIFRLREGTCL